MFRWMFLVVLGCSTASRLDEGLEGIDARVDGADAALLGDGSAARTIKVLTMNLKTALPSDDTYAQRTKVIADLIATDQPDVVALQEITESSSMTNRGQALAAMTGYQWRWTKTHQLLVGNEGIGILARGPIAWSDDAELPHTELGLLHRAVLGARVMIDGKSVELFATHLTVAGSVDDRIDQVTAALAFAHANHQSGVPAFFAGDLNAEPAESSMQLIRSQLIDAWPASAGPGYTIPSDGPNRRIDYIYAFPGATATSCKTVLAQPVGGIRASDHLGVMCSFVY